MAFSRDKFEPKGGGFNQAPRNATYATADSKATVETAGYFDEASDELQDEDLILVVASNATKVYEIAIAAGVVTLGAPPNQAAFVADASAGSAAEIIALRDAFIASGLMAAS